MNEKLGWKEWDKPGDKHLINRVQWDRSEAKALERVLETDWFGYGSVQQGAEAKFSKTTGIPHVYLQNSGSASI